ncbi:MAG: hypothetical protein Q4C58_07240 [Eubacteriales bacterium]|nr:hypothetical protein [Eubacteriales bacterium]
MGTTLEVAVQLVSAVIEEGKKELEFIENTVVPKLRAKVAGCLNRSNIGRAVLQVIRKAKIKLKEDRLKLAIQEMVDLEGVPVITVDVLDEMMDEIQLEIELECEQVGPDLRPGDIIYEQV